MEKGFALMEKRYYKYFRPFIIIAQQSKVLFRHAAKRIASTLRFLLFDIIIR